MIDPFMQNDNTIFVRSCPFPIGHTSPQEAIDDVFSQSQARESVRLTKELSGTVIESVEWADCSAVFHLADLNSLTILNTSGTLVWLITRRSSPSLDSVIEPRQLHLKFPSQDEPFAWNRAELLEARIGTAFVRILATDFGLFLYTERRLLLFSVIEKAEDASPMLFWDET